MLLDILHALRLFKRTPVLTIAIVATLAIGIGLNTGMFSVVTTMVYRARIEKDPASFVHMESKYSGELYKEGQKGSFTTDDYEAVRTRSQSLTTIAAWRDVHMTVEQEAQPTLGMLVTCNFFDLYGLEGTKMGRLFVGSECSQPADAPVVILSEEIWRQRFSSDPNIVGKPVKLNGNPFTVIGVVPAEFAGRLRGPGIWIPWTFGPQFYGKFFTHPNLFQQSQIAWLHIEARLKQGYTRSSAQTDLSVIEAAEDRLHLGRTTTVFVTDGSLAQDPQSKSLASLVVLLVMGSLLLILVVTCTNVITLLLSRTVARSGEMAIRLALGANRGKLMRMLTMESLILASFAGLVGSYLTYWIPQIFKKILPADAPHFPARMGAAEFIYLVVIVAFAGCLVGWMPATESLKVDYVSALKGEGTGITTSRRKSNILIALQMATSLVLIVGAGSFLRAQHEVISADPGFETKQVVMVPLNIKVPPYSRGAAWSFYYNLMLRVSGLPGVKSVSYASAIPFLNSAVESVFLRGESETSSREVSVDYVSLDFFETLRIPITRGRGFQKTDIVGDSSLPVAVISKSLAKTLWNDDNAVGRTILQKDNVQLQVIGVANNTKSEQYGSFDPPRLYRLQDKDSFGGPLLVRFDGDAHTLERAIVKMVAELDPQQISIPHTLKSEIDDLASRIWLITGLVMFFAGITIFLAMMGLYAIVAFSMRQRRREMGIRMALGATKLEILRLTMLSGLRPLLIGVAIAAAILIPGMLALRKVLVASPVYLSAFDPIVCGLSLLVLLAVAVAAMMGPAVQTASLDVIKTLRHD